MARPAHMMLIHETFQCTFRGRARGGRGKNFLGASLVPISFTSAIARGERTVGARVRTSCVDDAAPSRLCTGPQSGRCTPWPQSSAAGDIEPVCVTPYSSAVTMRGSRRCMSARLAGAPSRGSAE
jgi:hypothetical protein